MKATAKIKKKYDKLTAAEKKIADRVLSDSGSVTDMSVSELSRVCGTAPSAVIRFCRSCGFEGFRRFKLELAAELGSADSVSTYPDVIDESTVWGVFDRVFSNASHAISETRSMLASEEIEAAAEAVRRAKRVFLFGLGTSAPVVSDAQYRLMQLGKTAVAASDVLNMMVQAVNLTEGDLVIAVSHSGRTREILDSVKLAKQSGAKILTVTGYAESPIAAESDTVISVCSDEESSPVEAVASRLAQICVLDAIAASLMIADRANAEEHIKKRDSVLDEIREEL